MGHPAQSLQRHPSHGDAPDQSKQRPAPCAPQHTQGERGIGSCNQQIDRRVFDDPEHPLGAADWQRVIQGGGQVQQHHGGGEDAHADKETRIAMACRMRYQERGGHDCRDQPKPMAEAVRNFFPARLGAFGCRMRQVHDSAPVGWDSGPTG